MTVETSAQVVLSRLDLERGRLERIQDFRRTGDGASLVNRLAGDRLNAIASDLGMALDRLDRNLSSGTTQASLAELAKLQRAVDRAAAEALDLTMGALARRANLDAGACAESDILVDWLARRIDRRFTRPTMPGNEESLHRSTDVIHRRVPDYGLWDLPVMAHEFGHVVASGLRSWDPRDNHIFSPVESWLDQFDGMRKSRATELFCDVFATYAIGPSYLCALVFHRLSAIASAAASESDSHPSDPSRVYACQWTLQRIRGNWAQAHTFDRQMQYSRIAWESMQQVGRAEAALTTGQRAELHVQLLACWHALETNVSALRYGGVVTLHRLVEYLQAPQPGVDPVGFTPADVLNAAWTARLRGWYEPVDVPPDLEVRARSLLRCSVNGDSVG